MRLPSSALLPEEERICREGCCVQEDERQAREGGGEALSTRSDAGDYKLPTSCLLPFPLSFFDWLCGVCLLLSSAFLAFFCPCLRSFA